MEHLYSKNKINIHGYWCVYLPQHPYAASSGYVQHSRLVVEAILGTYLPENSIVHHQDKNTFNDSPNNLVVCEDRAYHLFIHARTRAYNACGNVHWRKCYFCKKYDDLKNLSEQIDYNSKTLSFKYCHKNCKIKYELKRLRTQKELGVMGANYGLN